ncbi:POT family proton-dependent oligopeptide transporter [[Emmonsia] crescens]|uniref:POT family proton-dependent oligopeptide transporter n=1 Tax=[Emmonsia] crescens TaxID=73230 RepID=A0A0G2J2U7_9EURO|nr:POT family proton-dependent oligopeptide transporter [Emmonsia crescens UAMH 3008]
MAYNDPAEGFDAPKGDSKEIAIPVKKVDLTEVDHYIDGDGPEPTEQELDTLRRIPDRIPWICFTIAFVELCERFAYYGTTIVLTNFVQQPLPVGSTTGNDPRSDGQPGALGKGQRASQGMVLFNKMWSYFAPLFGGYLADTKWGKMRTIQYSIALAMFGHIILIISALPPVIKNPDGAMGCLAVGLVVFGAGVGGFKPNISPLMVEQLKYSKMRVVERQGEKIILDPALTTQRIFMYFYLCINIGSIVGQVTMVYAERYVGFWLSYTLPTIMFCFCPLVLGVFHKRYTHYPPTESVLGNAVKLIKFACKGKISWNPRRTVRNLGAPAFWNDVKPSNVANKPKWMTFDDAWVEQVSRGTKACLVFAYYPLFWLAYNQIDGNLTSQAATLELNGVPNDLINNLNPLGIVIMIPILDLGVYPLLRFLKIRFSPLRRMAAGFFIATCAMIWAAVVQHFIYTKGACGKYMNTCPTPAPINVWVQAGAYVLVGLSEIMASITGLEYSYTKAPANMRGLVFGFYHFTSAVSAALGQAFVSVSEDPLLVWNYTIVAIIAFCGGVVFWLTFRGLDKKEEQMNMIKESEYRGRAREIHDAKVIDDEMRA